MIIDAGVADDDGICKKFMVTPSKNLEFPIRFNQDTNSN